MPRALRIELDAIGHDRCSALNQVVLNFSQCRSFAAARVKNTQLPTSNVERLENPG
jgi:hypothetical protein